MTFYLFPNVMYQRLNLIENGKKTPLSASLDPAIHKPLIAAHASYEICCLQYFGMGGLLQFIPGTNANRARKEFSRRLEIAVEQLHLKMEKSEISLKSSVKAVQAFATKAYQSSLQYWISLKPVIKISEDIVSGFKHTTFSKADKISLLRIAFELPILQDLFFINKRGKINRRKNAFTNLLHSILNPARLLDNLANFIHLSLNKLLDLWTSPKGQTIKKLLKGLVGITLGIIGIFIKLVKHLIDLIPLNGIKSFVFMPIVHVVKGARDTINHPQQQVMVLTVKELREIKKLKAEAKKHTPSYRKIHKATGSQTAYFGLDKAEVAAESLEIHDDFVLSLRAAKIKIQRMEALRNLLTHASPSTTTAIDEAKVVLGLSPTV